MNAPLRTLAVAASVLSIACSKSTSGTSGTSDSKPTIDSFSASPTSVAAGASSTLTWSVTGATSLSIDHGVGTPTGASATVMPTATTTYTLTASNSFGSSTAAATVTVNPLVPVISSFTASPGTIMAGQSSTLSWSVSNATSLSISQGVGTVAGTSKSVSPDQTTAYILSATGEGTTVTATATVHVLRLQYSDPAPGGAARLVRNAASTSTRAVLDLIVGSSPQSAFGLALDLAVDTGRATFDAATGFDIAGSALAPNANGEIAAKAIVPSTGPLAGVLVAGIAHRKTGPADLDQVLAAGALLARFSFDMKSGAAAGKVFDDTAFGAVLLSSALSPVVPKSGFAIGMLSVGE
ncbi:MAG: hypothetical protein E6J78_15170 [Deltaproteobacteria bacterium]|nr:MAG: hypothetical protein E6J78_15170 [Deltaproteobacteria bacterium]